jgi:hypothetical protein
MRQQPPDFRKVETRYVMDCWEKARASSIVGVGSVGKSNFLQHVTARTTLSSYLPNDAPKTLPIVLDANLLGSLGTNEMYQCWAGFELIVHRLYLSAYPFDLLDTDATLFFETYARDSSNPNYMYMGLRYLELAMQFFFRRGIKLILVFDEFELFLKYLPMRFFLNLRGLRDTQKGLLTFTTFTREPLPRLIERYGLSALEYEPFIELFNDNLYYLGPYSHRDALTMAKSVLGTNAHAHANDLVAMTGGFAGLIRAASKVIARAESPYTFDQLVEDRAIQEECATILAAVDEDERQVLNVALGKAPYNDTSHRAAVNLLVQKRLLSLNAESQSITVQPPLLKAYLERKS